MSKSGFLADFAGKVIITFLLVFTILLSGCSGERHLGKGKPGQVPCPCENKSKPR